MPLGEAAPDAHEEEAGIVLGLDNTVRPRLGGVCRQRAQTRQGQCGGLRQGQDKTGRFEPNYFPPCLFVVRTAIGPLREVAWHGPAWHGK